MLPSFIRLVKAPTLPEDESVRSLVRIIHWQTRFLILLVFLLSIAIASHWVRFDPVVKTYSAVPPPFSADAVQYKADVYSQERRARHGTRVFDSKLLLTGQVYDIKEIREAWPSFQFLINGAEIPLNQPTGTYTVEFNLTPGANIIETAYRIDGKEYGRRQMALTFEPYEPLLPIDTADLPLENHESL